MNAGQLCRFHRLRLVYSFPVEFSWLALELNISVYHVRFRCQPKHGYHLRILRIIRRTEIVKLEAYATKGLVAISAPGAEHWLVL